MGQQYEYRCPGCGYEARVSGGGDAGMIVSTQTVVCEQCKKLYDVITSRRDSFSERGGVEEVEPRCPRRKRHSIREWEHPGPCPKCGEDMHQGEMAILWD